MNIETKGLGAGSYPSPPETTKTINVEVSVTYKFETEVPKNWDNERIIDDIQANLDEYIYDSDITIHDISI